MKIVGLLLKKTKNNLGNDLAYGSNGSMGGETEWVEKLGG